MTDHLLESEALWQREDLVDSAELSSLFCSWISGIGAAGSGEVSPTFTTRLTKSGAAHRGLGQWPRSLALFKKDLARIATTILRSNQHPKHISSCNVAEGRGTSWGNRTNSGERRRKCITVTTNMARQITRQDFVSSWGIQVVYQQSSPLRITALNDRLMC